MCQNNLQNIHHAPVLKTHPSHHYNHTHKQTSTYSHYQTHLTKVTNHELKPYCMMLQARINNKHPNVVNVLSFQVLPQKQTLFLNSKELTEILVCTDKMIPLADHDWTKGNLTKILLALKRLAMIYGPFAVSAQHIGKNQHQEIKVWISKNVEKCKVDTSVPTQKDMLRNIAFLIDKKSNELAFRITPARTIRQAIDSLHSIFVYNSPQKHQKNIEWADLHFNKNFFSSLIMKFEGNRTLNSPSAKNQSLNQHFQFPKSAKQEPNDRNFISNHYSIFNSNTISRPQSKASNLFINKGFIKREDETLKNNFSQTPHNYNKPQYVPNTSYQPSRSNSRHLTFTPLNRLRNSSRGEHFSQRLGSERTAQNDGEAANSQINNFDITIINNNYSNYINNFSGNKMKQRSKSPVGKYPSFIHSKKQKAKSQGKSNKNSSFWMNSGKLNKNKSTTPYFFVQNKKPQSSHKQYILDSLEDTIPQFKRNNNSEYIKVEPPAPTLNLRKEKKLYTFFNPNAQEKKQVILTPKNNQNHNKFNFFKKTTPSNNNSRSNTTQFFPAKRYNLNNKSTELCQDEGVQKRFNSFAIDAHDEEDIASAIPTTKSMTIEQNRSVSSKKLQLKKQLKMQFGNLFNIAETTQSPRCSFSQNVKNNEIPSSQSKTQLLKESILKEKIKQKNEAFAQLKKEALKVLTDF